MRRLIHALLLLELAIPVVTKADVRASASYRVVTESLDPAGEAGASASYAAISALGGVVDTSSVSVPGESIKHGFVGQITEAASLSITGNATVGEGSTLQLAAREVFDDGTQLNLSTSDVTWKVVSGPISSVSGSGLVTTTAVYQDTVATAGGAAFGINSVFPFTVINTLSDNFGTYAGDGLPDDWQVQYFGVGNPYAGPTMDPDGDGYDNAFEYAAGLDPTSATSRFNLQIQSVVGQSTQRQIIFSPRFSTSSYTVQSSTDLINWSTLSGSVTDAGSQRTILDTLATGPRKFYRINVSKP